MQIDKILKKVTGHDSKKKKTVLANNANGINNADIAHVDSDSSKSKELHGNWYYDRYYSIVVQRNILLVLLLVSIFLIIISVLVVMYINSSHVIEPFIIEVEKKTGVATLVDTSGVKRFSANKAVNDYFLVKYIDARELFDPDNYTYNWYTVVRLLSTSGVYRKFLSSTSIDGDSTPVLNTTNSKIKIRSIQYLSDSSVQIRFAIESEGLQKNVYSKVALITFSYDDTSLTREQRYVNPLGFAVTSYRVTDELDQ